MNDILEGLYVIQREFRKRNLEVPKAIVLGTNYEGVRFLGSLSINQRGSPATIVEHPDGQVFCKIEVIGMEVHWPADRLALHNGEYWWV